MGRAAAIRVLVVLLAVTGSCNSDGVAEQPEAPGFAAATTTAADAGPPTTDPAIRIVLGAGRLTVGGNAVVFGAPANQVSSYLGRALGDPHDESDQDCGPGHLRVLAWPSLQVFLLDGRLVGWIVDDDTYATDAGISIGSTRDDLQAAHPGLSFVESSLGDEFSVEPQGDAAAGLSGLLEEDRVRALWSGATCIAR